VNNCGLFNNKNIYQKLIKNGEKKIEIYIFEKKCRRERKKGQPRKKTRAAVKVKRDRTEREKVKEGKELLLQHNLHPNAVAAAYRW
jgi:hypothetical protein